MRGRTPPPAEPPPEDDLPWHDDPAQPGTTPPLPDQNRLVDKDDLEILKMAIREMKINPEKMYDYMEKEFGKRDPKICSVHEITVLTNTIRHTPGVVNQGMGF
jgi:hypothetical protein